MKQKLHRQTYRKKTKEINLFYLNFNTLKHMAKKSMIERQTKRIRLVKKYKTKRAAIKQEMQQTDSLSEKLALSFKLQSFPRNSSATRLNNRCLITGRPKGYYRDFGLSRHVLREMGHQCLLPGLRKSSW